MCVSRATLNCCEPDVSPRQVGEDSQCREPRPGESLQDGDLVLDMLDLPRERLFVRETVAVRVASDRAWKTAHWW